MPKDMSYMYPLFPIVCFITILLTFFPVPAHWKAGNIATVALAFWIIGGLMFCLVNTIVWHGNLRNPYPIWGDITCAYIVMLGPAIASCILSIQFRLWNVARTKRIFITQKEKRRHKWLTYFLCLGLPFLIIPIHYVVQGHRYNVYEDLGPLYTTHNVTLAYGIFWIIEPTVCLIACIFAILTIRLFLRRRKELDVVLCAGSNVNKGSYIRLLALAATAIVIHFPLSLWIVIINAVVYPAYPFISWENTHSNWMRIAYISRFMLSRTPRDVVFLSISWWCVPAAGWFYFGFFGFGQQAMTQSHALSRAVLKLFGIDWPKETSSRRRRRRTRRTWLDVILCRPGRLVNPMSSTMTTTTVMPDFNASASYPENSVIETSPNGTTKNNTMAADKKKNSKHSSKKRTKKLSEKSRGQHRSMMMATSMGTGDWSLDVADLDFLDPVEAKKQARIAAYKRREERRAATASGGRAVGKKKRSVESFEWSIGEVDEEEQEVEQPKKEGKEVEGRVGVDDNSSDEDGSSICTDSNCSCQVDDFSALHDEGEDVTEQGQNNVQVDMNLAAVVPRDDTASSGRQTSSLDETKLVPLEMSTAIVAPVSAVHKGEQQQQQQRHVTIVDARERDLEKGAAPDGGDEEEEETEEERDLRIRVQEFKEEFRTAHPDATEEITF